MKYKPWVQIQDFLSKGIVLCVRGRTTGRIHHLMSNLELRYFYLLDWPEKTTEIREQFPLGEILDAIEISDRRMKKCRVHLYVTRVRNTPILF